MAQSRTVFVITLVILGTQNQKQSMSRVNIQQFLHYMALPFTLVVRSPEFRETVAHDRSMKMANKENKVVSTVHMVTCAFVRVLLSRCQN